MTETQRKYLQFIHDFAVKNKRYPTRNEIAKGLNIPRRNVLAMVERLMLNQYIIRAPYKREVGKLTEKACYALGI